MQVTKGYSEPIPTSKIEPFAKIVNGYSSLITLAKSSMLGIRLGSTNILNEKKKLISSMRKFFVDIEIMPELKNGGWGRSLKIPRKSDDNHLH